MQMSNFPRIECKCCTFNGHGPKDIASSEGTHFANVNANSGTISVKLTLTKFVHKSISPAYHAFHAAGVMEGSKEGKN